MSVEEVSPGVFQVVSPPSEPLLAWRQGLVTIRVTPTEPGDQPGFTHLVAAIQWGSLLDAVQTTTTSIYIDPSGASMTRRVTRTVWRNPATTTNKEQPS